MTVHLTSTMAKTRKMIKDLEKSKKSDKARKNRSRKKSISANIPQSKNGDDSRGSSIDELLKICRPLSVKLVRCNDNDVITALKGKPIENSTLLYR